MGALVAATVSVDSAVLDWSLDDLVVVVVVVELSVAGPPAALAFDEPTSDAIARAFCSTSLEIASARMCAELETFIWKNGRPEALSGYNDDLTMALCIGLWVRDTALRLRQEGIELTKMALDKAKYNVVGHIYTNRDRAQNPYEMQVGTGKEDICI